MTPQSYADGAIRQGAQQPLVTAGASFRDPEADRVKRDQFIEAIAVKVWFQATRCQPLTLGSIFAQRSW